MVLFGAILVPFVWRLEKAKNQKELVEDIQKKGGVVLYSWQMQNPNKEQLQSRRSSVLRRLFGNDMFDGVVAADFNAGRTLFLGVKPTHAFDFERLAALRDLEELNLSFTEIDSLDSLAGLNKIKQLDISGSKVPSLDGISRMTKLERLDVHATKVSDVTPLSGLMIEWLDLEHTAVVDIGPLKKCRNLKTLNICKQKLVDWSLLLELERLEKLYVSREYLDEDTWRELRNAKPDLDIRFEYWRVK